MAYLDDGDKEGTEGAEGGAPENQGGEEGDPLKDIRQGLAADDAPAGDAPKGDEPKGDDAPTLTQEQIDQIVNDPNIRQKVLESDGAQKSLDDLIREAVQDSDDEREVQRERDASQQTVEDALKQAEEDGDYSALGELAAKQLKETRARESYRSEHGAEVVSQFDAAISDVFGDAINSLSEEDRKALNRSNFANDSEFTRAVVLKLRDTDRGLTRTDLGSKLKAAEEAARNAGTGDKARGDGDAMLGGGSPNAPDSGDASIGDLMREGLTDALDYEE